MEQVNKQQRVSLSVAPCDPLSNKPAFFFFFFSTLLPLIFEVRLSALALSLLWYLFDVFKQPLFDKAPPFLAAADAAARRGE